MHHRVICIPWNRVGHDAAHVQMNGETFTNHNINLHYGIEWAAPSYYVPYHSTELVLAGRNHLSKYANVQRPALLQCGPRSDVAELCVWTRPTMLELLKEEEIKVKLTPVDLSAMQGKRVFKCLKENGHIQWFFFLLLLEGDNFYNFLIAFLCTNPYCKSGIH